MCNTFPSGFNGNQRWERLKHRWERLPKTHKIAFTGEVLHIYGRVVGKKALHHCGNYCTCLKLCALSMLTSVYTYIYLYVMHHHVKVQTSQVPRAVARRMIIFGNGWVPLGHLTMYRQECHNAQHTRGYIESTKSNFSGQDKSGIF